MFCGKDGICVMWLVIPSRGSRVVFWGHVWESKLTAVWSLVPLCYMYQSCSFTWFDLPVINSLEGGQSLRCDDCLLCARRASSALAGGYLALWCGSADPSAENDPAVVQMPSVLISMMFSSLSFCPVPAPTNVLSSAPQVGQTESNREREFPLWIP